LWDLAANATSLLAPGKTQTPDLVAPLKILHGVGNSAPWFSTSFGHVTSASGGRTLQIGAKLNARRAG